MNGLKPKLPVVRNIGSSESGDEQLFALYYAHCVSGLLACNTRYDNEALCVQENFEQAELLEKAEELAEKMLEATRDRMEVKRFERKVK
jgi:hypothetical protein